MGLLLIAIATIVLIIDIIIFPIIYFVDPNRKVYHQLNALVTLGATRPFFKTQVEVRRLRGRL